MAGARRDRQSARMRRRYTKEQRTQLVDLVASGDVTVPEAAAKLGVTSSAAYNWVAESRKQQRPNAVRRVAGPTFVCRVPSGATDATITVRVGEAEIQVRPGIGSTA
jgi:transposase-like protein